MAEVFNLLFLINVMILTLIQALVLLYLKGK